MGSMVWVDNLVEAGRKNGDRQSVAVVSFDEVEIDLDRSFCVFYSF
jgi:hypothetical protein